MDLAITYEGKEYKIPQLSSTLDFIQKNNIKVQEPVAAVINGYFTRLNKKIRVGGNLEIIELETSLGRRVYESSVLFMVRVAAEKLFPGTQLFMQHSIHKGVYVEFKNKELNDQDVQKIETFMRDMVKKATPIERVTNDWDVSLKQMEEKDRSDLINLFRYYPPSIFKSYTMEGVSECFYMPLVPNASYVKNFTLKKYQQGVVVMMPDFDKNKGFHVPEFVDKPKLFNTYKEYNEWTQILHVRTVGQLNESIMRHQISDMIKVAEALHEKKVGYIADMITKREFMPRAVLIAGPSSSGKTTFSKRLGIQLMVNGLRPVAISLDNYFVDREMTPRDENGDYDFETLEALDIQLFNQHLNDLLNGKEVEIPVFDFHTGKRKSTGTRMQLDPDQIMIIEGIHGINPKLTEQIAEKHKFKIYIAPLTQINLHRHDRITASDTRLIRRIVRDNNFRGYSAEDTILRWGSVRSGEKKNIFPLQEEADVIFNSALFYELSLLKGHAERELLRIQKNSEAYVEAQRLLKFLSYFLVINDKDVPNTSIMKEFIGGSTFEY